MSKHTKGPWQVAELDLRCIEETATGLAIADLRTGNAADSFLIAAAPELLESLQLIADTPRDSGSIPQVIVRMQRIARAAIAKATGEQS